MKKIHVITSAQLDTGVNHRFLNTLMNYCKLRGAELHVIPLFYKNPDVKYLIEDELKDDHVPELDESLQEFEVDAHNILELNSSLQINPLPIRPTIANPLSSLNRVGGGKSQIFGSPKITMLTVPNSNYKLPKVILTTGAVTVPNYSLSKTGVIADNDHKYGAVVVELVDDKIYHFRHLEANGNGEINDLGIRYSGNQYYEQECAEALILGDWHIGATDPEVERITFEEIIPTFKPKKIVVHDLNDLLSINPHQDKNNFLKSIKSFNGTNCLRTELLMGKGVLEKFDSIEDSKTFIVSSNHPNWLKSWLVEDRYIKDPYNRRIGIELNKMLYDEFGDMDFDEYPDLDPIKMYYKSNADIENVTFLSINDDLKIAGIQCGNHGHLGSHGARGSNNSLELANSKQVVGHTHTPSIFRGIYHVGTSTKLQLEYTEGFSGWMNTHCLVYSDGTRQLINIINGKWRG